MTLSVDTDVIVVGAGPTGLMLAGDLALAGVQVIVLEREPGIPSTARAGAVFGQILDVLRHRGLLERLEAAAGGPVSTPPAIPFGNLYLALARLPEPAMPALRIPQPTLQRVLAEWAAGLGAGLRFGLDLLAVSDEGDCDGDGGRVAVAVRGPDGHGRLTARWVVGCDGPSSPVRAAVGIGFPGETYSEVNRLATVGVHPSVTLRPDGDLEVPGLGLLRSGFTRTERGTFAFARSTPGVIGVQTTEDDGVPAALAGPLTLTEFRQSVRRVLGVDLPLGEVTRLSRYGYQGRIADRYRAGRVLVAGDAAHQFPATGIGINVGMTDAVNLAWKLAAQVRGWAPPGLLDTYHDERHTAAGRHLMHARAQALLRREQDPAVAGMRALFSELAAHEETLRHLGELVAGTSARYPAEGGHPLAGAPLPELGAVRWETPLLGTGSAVLLDFTGREGLRDTAAAWDGRVDVVLAPPSSTREARPAGALLVRPDAFVAWAAGVDEPEPDTAASLTAALHRWCGEPVVGGRRSG